jgi:hypothetical protein
MEELTPESLAQRASQSASRLVKALQQFNNGHSGPDPLYAPHAFSSELASIFAQLLADRSVVASRTEEVQRAGVERRKP